MDGQNNYQKAPTGLVPNQRGNKDLEQALTIASEDRQVSKESGHRPHIFLELKSTEII